MGLFSFVGGLFGGGSQKKASRKAEAAMVDAYNKGIAEQQRQFDLTRSDYAPYLGVGLKGLEGLGNLTGVNGNDALTAALAAIESSPELASRIRIGEDALLANASATGGLRGGNTEHSLFDLRGDLLAEQIGTQLQRYAGLVGMGQGATDSVSAFGQNKANNVTGLLGQIGGAKASGALTRGGINAKMWNNAGSFLDSAVSAALPSTGFLGKLKGIF